MDEARLSPGILFVSAAVFPLAKTGGLARIMLPGYSQALDLARDLNTVDSPEGRLLTDRMPDSDVPVILFDAPALFRRSGGLYQDAGGQEWPDNDHRFAALNRAVALVALGGTTLGWRPEIVHANDWHTGTLPALLHYSGQPRPKTVFTIHNLAFQGNFPLTAFPYLGLPTEVLSPDGIEFYKQISFIKAGIRYSDQPTNDGQSDLRA